MVSDENNITNRLISVFFLCIYAPVYIFVCVQVHVFVYTDICVCVYTYSHMYVLRSEIGAGIVANLVLCCCCLLFVV